MARLHYGWKTNVSKIKRQTQKGFIQLHLDTKRFVAKKIPQYTLQAKGIIMTVVYGAYSPQIYHRSYDLLDSIKGRIIRDGYGIEIYQDSHMTPLKSGGKYAGYGHYFIEPAGSFLAQTRMPQSLSKSLPRDFARAWFTHFQNVITRDYLLEVWGSV